MKRLSLTHFPFFNGRFKICLGLIGVLLTTPVWGISSEMKQAQAFVEITSQGPADPIEPLPEFTDPVPYLYSAGNLRSPFDSPLPQANNSKDAPDVNRPKELLEAYALDSLHMVGTIQKAGQSWALIAAPTGMIYRVTLGSHMGENYGEVTSISNDKVQLVETVPNGVGGWSKRDASLGLSNE